MIAVEAVHDLSFADWAILVAVAGYIVTRVAEARGWMTSTGIVRRENADLRERNATLEGEVRRLDEADRAKAERIAALEARLADLETRDQAAVLAAIAKHDESMVTLGRSLSEHHEQHERTARERRVQQQVEHDEAMGVWREILRRTPDPEQEAA